MEKVVFYLKPIIVTMVTYHPGVSEVPAVKKVKVKQESAGRLQVDVLS